MVSVRPTGLAVRTAYIGLISAYLSGEQPSGTRPPSIEPVAEIDGGTAVTCRALMMLWVIRLGGREGRFQPTNGPAILELINAVHFAGLSGPYLLAFCLICPFAC